VEQLLFTIVKIVLVSFDEAPLGSPGLVKGVKLGVVR